MYQRQLSRFKRLSLRCSVSNPSKFASYYRSTYNIQNIGINVKDFRDKSIDPHDPSALGIPKKDQ